MKLRFTPRATRDLADIADYIHERNPTAALRVRAAILDSLQDLGCGLIKPEPEAKASNFEHGEIVQGAAVVAGCNVSELLELIEAALDQIAFLVLGLAVGDAVVAV